MEESGILEKFDFVLFLCVLLLVTTGVFFIYSSGVNSNGVLVTNEYVKQITWGSVGVVFLVIFSLLDYRRLKGITHFLYIALILLLVYTRLFGRYVNGAKSWIGLGDYGVQPSEFGKVIFILFLARYLDNSAQEPSIKRIALAFFAFLLPVGLILLQPDLGTASVYIPVFFFMCFMTNIPLRYIFFLLASLFSVILFTILPVWNEYIMNNSVIALHSLSNKNIKLIIVLATLLITILCIVARIYLKAPRYFYWLGYTFLILSIGLSLSFVAEKVLKEYQIKRLIVFMNPQVDSLGAGWNIIQSKIAIGAGGRFGRGFLGGTQSHYRFLPQQSTDFIFSIFSEEMGFLGGAVIFSIYMIIVLRILLIMRACKNPFGLYISSGVLGMFVVHFFINVGMVMGIMPITGIPLLFMSYGGSSLFTAMICIGLVISVNRHRDVMLI